MRNIDDIISLLVKFGYKGLKNIDLLADDFNYSKHVGSSMSQYFPGYKYTHLGIKFGDLKNHIYYPNLLKYNEMCEFKELRDFDLHQKDEEIICINIHEYIDDGDVVIFLVLKDTKVVFSSADSFYGLFTSAIREEKIDLLLESKY